MLCSDAAIAALMRYRSTAPDHATAVTRSAAAFSLPLMASIEDDGKGRKGALWYCGTLASVEHFFGLPPIKSPAAWGDFRGAIARARPSLSFRRSLGAASF
jgi:hypothetical protein